MFVNKYFRCTVCVHSSNSISTEFSTSFCIDIYNTPARHRLHSNTKTTNSTETNIVWVSRKQQKKCILLLLMLVTVRGSEVICRFASKRMRSDLNDKTNSIFFLFRSVVPFYRLNPAPSPTLHANLFTSSAKPSTTNVY